MAMIFCNEPMRSEDERQERRAITTTTISVSLSRQSY
jgi:hypothetical protein